MARVKDLWLDSNRRKTARHPDRGGNKDAKRWLAIWIGPDGREVTKAFRLQDAARKYSAKQEADIERGEYIDPKAGREKFGDLALKALRLRKMTAGSRRRYESVYRNHVEPVFGSRSVKSIRPSELADWLNNTMGSRSNSIRATAYLVALGAFELAAADKLRTDNPMKSKIVPKFQAGEREREPWDAVKVWKVIDQHPEPYRAIPILAAGLGLRQGCVLGLAEEDFDFEAMTMRVRRQISRESGTPAFKLPKGGKERTVPISRGVAQAVQAHVKAYPPQSYTLPWQEEDGREHGSRTVSLLFRWHGDDRRTCGRHVVAAAYDLGVWKPSLSRAGIIPPPVRGHRGTMRYKGGDRDDGMHALRHFYSATLQNAGVPLIGVMDFMGHSRKGAPVTLGVYGHVTAATMEQARSAIDRELFRLRSVGASDGTVTELRQAT
jgi:integrase